MNLHLDWCSAKAATYATKKWHYTGTTGTPPQVRVGAWERGAFVGVVLFARGANKNIGRPYGLEQIECCELVRVALSDSHESPTSRIVSRSIRLLKGKEPKLRLVVSYADKNQDHEGVIYQAMNWIYTGETSSSYMYKWKDGNFYHQREVSATGKKPYYGQLRIVPKINECEKIPQLGKHKYLYPLDKAIRRQVEALSKPYPKHANVGEMESR